MENSATLAADVAGEPHSARNRRLRAVIRPWLTPKVIAGGTIVLILVVVGLLAPVIAPYDPNAQNLSQALRPPDWFSGAHALGTDAVGRDILSRLFYGARVSLVIAVMVVIISGVVRPRPRRDLRLLRGKGRFPDTEARRGGLGVSAAAPGDRHHGVPRPRAGKPHPRPRQPAMDRLLPGVARPGAFAADPRVRRCGTVARRPAHPHHPAPHHAEPVSCRRW